MCGYPGHRGFPGLFSAWESCERATKQWKRVATHLRRLAKKRKIKKNVWDQGNVWKLSTRKWYIASKSGFFEETLCNRWIRRDFVIRAFCFPQRKYTRAVFFNFSRKNEKIKRHTSSFLHQQMLFSIILGHFTTVFVDMQLWKTKNLQKRFQNFHQSCMLSTDRIEIHQSQLDSTTQKVRRSH